METIGDVYKSGLGYVLGLIPGKGVFDRPDASSVCMGTLYSRDEHEFLCANYYRYNPNNIVKIYAGEVFWEGVYWAIQTWNPIIYGIATKEEYDNDVLKRFWLEDHPIYSFVDWKHSNPMK